MLTQQLIEGVRFAHSRGIAHRNLHCGHLLVDDQKNNGNGQLVIASWAASRGFRDVGKRSPLRSCTVPYYIAPEGLIIPPVQQIDPDSIDETAYDDIGTFDGTDNGDESTVEEEKEEEEEERARKRRKRNQCFRNSTQTPWTCGRVVASLQNLSSVPRSSTNSRITKVPNSWIKFCAFLNFLEHQTKSRGRMLKASPVGTRICSRNGYQESPS